jgi:hypothetical protein
MMFASMIESVIMPRLGTWRTSPLTAGVLGHDHPGGSRHPPAASLLPGFDQNRDEKGVRIPGAAQ